MRARNIKPGFFDNEQIGGLTPAARLLFIGLWCLADKDGILEYRPQRIKIKVFPYDSFNLIKLLEEVSLAGLITIWADQDKVGQFIEIPTFLKHQKPHPKEKASNLKEILDGSENLIKLHEIKCNSRLMLGKRNVECGKRNVEETDGFRPESIRPDWILEDDWADLIFHRKKHEKKPPQTKRAYTAIIKELRKAVDAGYTVTDCIDALSQSTWQTFKAEYMHGHKQKVDSSPSKSFKGQCATALLEDMGHERIDS